MSQGAIEHVVAGIQAKDPAKKEAVLAKLTPATLMQSCNEQLADFFKDMKASEQEIAAEQDAVKQRRATGEAFVHASKYLVRLLDAAQILSDKFAQFEPPVPLEFALLKAAKVKTPKELMAKVEAVLLALRKSSTVPADAKGEVGVDEVRTVFGVDDIGAFRKLISDFGVGAEPAGAAQPGLQGRAGRRPGDRAAILRRAGDAAGAQDPPRRRLHPAGHSARRRGAPGGDRRGGRRGAGREGTARCHGGPRQGSPIT